MKNTIIRLCTKPKSWRARGNLEFEELLLLSLYWPSIAEPEIQKRYSATWANYQFIRRTQVMLTGLASQLAAGLITSFVLHSMLVAFMVAPLLLIVAIGFIQINKRSEILWDNMNDCYAWLFREILHPAECEISANIMAAFERFCEKDEKRPIAEKKKLKRIIIGFGYTTETINN